MIAADKILAAEDTDKAGPLGLLVLIILIVACYFLFKSMSKHLRRVREEFPGDSPVDVATAEGGDFGSDRGTPERSASGPTGASVRAAGDRVDPPAE